MPKIDCIEEYVSRNRKIVTIYVPRVLIEVPGRQPEWKILEHVKPQETPQAAIEAGRQWLGNG